MVEPLDVTRSRYTLFAFVPRDVKKGSAGRLLQSLTSAMIMRQLKRILREDMELWPKVQEGLIASQHSGILSRREERIWAFQKYIREFQQRPEVDTIQPLKH